MEVNQTDGTAHDPRNANTLGEEYTAEYELQWLPIHAKDEDHKEEGRNKAREGLSFVLLGRVKGHPL
jgi:hypothetical protein